MKNYTRPPLVVDEDEKVIIGKIIEDMPIRLDTIVSPSKNVVIEGYIFDDLDVRDTKTDLKIISLKITDETDSIYGKIFVNSEEDRDLVVGNIKKNKYYKFGGEIKDDNFSKELVLMIKDINVSSKTKKEIVDDAPIKRVELHAHTMMSQMDGVTKLDLSKHTCELVEKAIQLGYKGVAITDHSGCQAFPISFGIINFF